MPDGDEAVRCDICGTEFTADESQISALDFDASVCPSCNLALAQSSPEIRSVDFEKSLADLLVAEGDFSELLLHPQFTGIGGARTTADIAVTERTPSGGRILIIECKATTALTNRRLNDVVDHIDRLRLVVPHDWQRVLAIPTLLDTDQRVTLSDHGIEVWDLPYLRRRFGKHASRISSPVLKTLLSTVPIAIHAKLIDDLRKCEPGRASWSVYQKLVRRILEALFCPPLSPSLYELSDDADVNRRDIILPNYCHDGLWAYWRSRYKAEFLVVDAKNYSERVNKNEVLKLANYLKPGGAGMFGMLVSRHGVDDGAAHTIREQWMHYEKMIVSVTDADLEKMLRARSRTFRSSKRRSTERERRSNWPRGRSLSRAMNRSANEQA